MRFARLLTGAGIALALVGVGVLLYRPPIAPGAATPEPLAGGGAGPSLGLVIRADDCYGCNLPTASIRQLVATGRVSPPVRVLVVGPPDSAVSAYFRRQRIPVDVSFQGRLATLRRAHLRPIPLMIVSSDRTVQAVHPLPGSGLDASSILSASSR